MIIDEMIVYLLGFALISSVITILVVIFILMLDINPYFNVLKKDMIDILDYFLHMMRLVFFLILILIFILGTIKFFFI